MTDRLETRRPSVVAIADLELDLATLEVHRAGVRLEVAPQAARVLAVLAERPGELVTREELYQAVWPDREVDVDRGLNTLIRQLRIGLGDSADRPRYIRTYPRRGYRLVIAEALGALEAAGPEPAARPAGRLPRAVVRRALVVIAAAAVLVVASSVALRSADPPAALVVSLTGDVSTDSLAASQLVSDLRDAVAAALPAGSAEVVGWSLPGTAGAAEALAVGGQWLLAARPVATGDSLQLALHLIDLGTGDTLLAARGAAVGAGDLPGAVTEAAQALRHSLLRGKPGAAQNWPGLRPAVARLEGTLATRYLAGRHLLRAADPTLRSRAVEPLAEVAHHSASTRAYYAEALWWAGRLDAATAQADTALALDPDEPHALFIAGVLAHLRDWDAARAGRLFDQAIARQPGRPEYLAARAFLDATTGRTREAMAAVRAVYRLDPISATLVSDIGEIALYAGDNRLAAEYCALAASLEAAPRSALQCAFEANVAVGDSSAAAVIASRIVALSGGSLGSLPDSLPAGDRVRLLRLRQADGAAAAPAGGRFRAAGFLAAAGRPEAAIAALGLAVVGHEPMVIAAAVHPRLRSLHRESAFRALIRPVLGATAPVVSDW